jgi:hypothetical protein
VERAGERTEEGAVGGECEFAQACGVVFRGEDGAEGAEAL